MSVASLAPALAVLTRASLSVRPCAETGFEPRLVHVVFVVDEVFFFLHEYVDFPCLSHSTIARYYCSVHISPTPIN